MTQQINPGRLQYAPLQKAIYQMQPIPELLGTSSQWLQDYRIADYVGRRELGDADPQWQRPGPLWSEKLFEDQGGFLYRFRGNDEFDIAVFATFLVVEINPGKDNTEFLVIAPLTPEQDVEELPYAAFLKGQNTSQLQDRLRDKEQQTLFSAEIERLIAQLRQPVSNAAGGFFSRLFSRH